MKNKIKFLTKNKNILWGILAIVILGFLAYLSNKQPAYKNMEQATSLMWNEVYDHEQWGGEYKFQVGDTATVRIYATQNIAPAFNHSVVHITIKGKNSTQSIALEQCAGNWYNQDWVDATQDHTYTYGYYQGDNFSHDNALWKSKANKILKYAYENWK